MQYGAGAELDVFLSAFFRLPWAIARKLATIRSAKVSEVEVLSRLR